MDAIEKGLRRELEWRRGLVEKAQASRDWYSLKVELARVRILEGRLDGREVGIPVAVQTLIEERT